ncbi:MAG: O-antigen ligase family protein [Chloroflexi bacterium]|nr:O-antigen ligase family protein [Chloroflexota bacterium]
MGQAILIERNIPTPKPGWPILTAMTVVILSLFLGWVIVSLKGLPLVIVMVLAPFMLLFAMAKPRHALYLLVALALIVDEKLTAGMQLHRGVGELTDRVLYWIPLTPLELLLMAALLGYLARAACMKTVPVRLGTFFWLMVPLFLFILFGLITGLMRGGDRRMALWELRAIFYMPGVYLLFYNTIKTKQHLQIIAWIILLSIGFVALLGSWTYFVILGTDLGERQSITDHQQGIFFNVLFLLPAAHAIYRSRGWQRWVALAAVPLGFVTWVATDRRSAYVALVVGFVALLALAYRDDKSRVVKLGLALAVISGLYAGVFWNSSGFWAKPLQGVRSVEAQPGDPEYASNQYRELEKWNIALTIRNNALFGVGFGNEFEMYIPMAYWDSPFRNFITHNSVLWVWMKTGVAGFIAYLMFLCLAISGAARVYRKLPDWQLKPPLAVGLAFIIMYTIYSYVDQGWDYKGMVYSGVVLGSFAVIERMLLSRTE